jgi:hypothetical protein
MVKTINPKEIGKYTDEVYLKLKSDNPASVLKSLLEFGEYLSKQFPDKNNEEIQKALTKSHITFDTYTLGNNELANLGAMNGIATQYYSARDDKCEEMLAKGDDSLFRTYKAWKIATVVFAYFVGDSVKGDLFAHLKDEVKNKTQEWSKEVNKHADDIVNERILELAKQQDTINKMQAVCIQYQNLIVIDLKKSALTLPQVQLNVFLDKKGTINVDKMLEESMSKYPEIQKAKKRYKSISKLRDALADTKTTPSARLDKFNSLVKDPKIITPFTNNGNGKKLWASFLSLIRAVRVTGVAGMFHGRNKRRAKTQFLSTVGLQPVKRPRA